MDKIDVLITSIIVSGILVLILALMPKRTWGENADGIGQVFKKDKKWKN